jgi:hypothetical protein
MKNKLYAFLGKLKTFLITSQMEETTSQMRPQREAEDHFLRVLNELAKLTKKSKGGVLVSALNLYYRAVTLPAADLELLQSFLKDLEKKQGIDWSATANPHDPPSVA